MSNLLPGQSHTVSAEQNAGARVRSRSRTQKVTKRVSARLLGDIRSGALLPGDRLPSIRELCAQYKVSQKIIERVLDELKVDGIIESRARSGNFVAASAARLRADEPAPPPAMPLDHYLMPRRSTSKPLTIYVTDIYPARLEVWREVLDAYAKREGLPGIAILTPLDSGHLEEVLAKRSVDVVETSSILLSSFAREHFADLATTGVVDEFTYTPVVAEGLSTVKRGPGLPFALTVHCLFVNMALWSQAGLAALPQTLPEFLEVARTLSEKWRECPYDSLTTPSLVDLPELSGALISDASGLLAVDTERLLDVFMRIKGAKFHDLSSADVMTQFERGALLFMKHCSFSIPEMRKIAGLDVHICPMPAIAKVPVDLSVLAVMRQTHQLSKSLALVRHLLSDDIQARFGDLGGNLPVAKDALERVMAVGSGPLPTPELAAVLANCALVQARDDWQRFGQSFAIHDLLLTVNDGRMSPEQAVTTVANNLAVYRSLQS